MGCDGGQVQVGCGGRPEAGEGNNLIRLGTGKIPGTGLWKHHGRARACTLYIYVYITIARVCVYNKRIYSIIHTRPFFFTSFESAMATADEVVII